MRHQFARLIAFTLLVTPCLHAQRVEALDDRAVEILRKHGLEKSRVMDHLSWICDVHGPRLTGSPNLRRAQAWAKKTLASWGLSNARHEEWGPFGRGWRLDKFAMHVVGDNPWPVLAYPKAWSPGLPGKLVADVVAIGSMTKEQLEAADLTGKIVLIQKPRDVAEFFEGPARRFGADNLLEMANAPGGREARRDRRARDQRRRAGFQRQRQMMEIVYGKKPAAILDRGSKGQSGTIFVTSASAPSVKGQRGNARDPMVTGMVPQFTLAVEHYNRLARVLDRGVGVRMEIELDVTFFDDDLMERNVLADIPGTDPVIGDQIVMLGAHFDSWHSGTGATDNGCGSAVMMEAVRLIRELMNETGTSPRRTIRIGLWSGEEQGLLGSRAYVGQHFAESAGRGQPPSKLLSDHAKLSGYFNLDNGTGKLRGVYLQGNHAVATIFRSWLRPFKDLGASTLSLGNTGGTDHLAFDAVGLPGFQFIQDPVAYSTQTHHSNMDNWDHAVAEDLKQAATIIASFVWHAAQRDEMLPRKPLAIASDASKESK